ncbi:MAG: type II toxin-antitoxin system RelE/ParE family toxin [Patescibacteria group bacterium]
MEKYKITYHPKVTKIDIPRLGSVAKKLLIVIYRKLAFYPETYGLPLHSPLKGYWKLRIGDYRAIYKVVNNEVKIQVMGHRKKVYEIAKKRLGLI